MTKNEKILAARLERNNEILKTLYLNADESSRDLILNTVMNNESTIKSAR